MLLPRPTTLSLIHAHQHSLRKLRVVVYDEWSCWASSPCAAWDEDGEGGGGPPAAEGGVEECEEGFVVVPFGEDCLRSSCWDDLSCEVLDGGYDILASMALLWLGSLSHDSWRCQRFARDLAANRPHMAVHCDECHKLGLLTSGS